LFLKPFFFFCGQLFFNGQSPPENPRQERPTLHLSTLRTAGEAGAAGLQAW
jgi:hypothetical protein